MIVKPFAFLSQKLIFHHQLILAKVMSLSSLSASDDCSSAGGESTGRVVRAEDHPDSKSSSATPSCMNDSNAAPTVGVSQETDLMSARKNLRPGYQWVNPRVREYFSKYRSAMELRNFLSHSQIYYSDIENDIISFRRVGDADNVFHGREDDSYEFFYFYACFFRDLHIRLPLNNFQIGVLNFLNVAPTQLHPNGWDAMQAFSILCKLLSLSPSPASFLYYYCSRPGTRSGWLSLISKSNVCFLKPFTSSYKEFKGGFFKILVEPIGKEYFFNGESPKFPLYWTRDPVKFNSISFHSMGAADRYVIEVFSHLSHQIPTRALLKLYTSSHPQEDLIGRWLFFIFLFYRMCFLTLLSFLLISSFDGKHKSKSSVLFFEASEQSR